MPKFSARRRLKPTINRARPARRGASQNVARRMSRRGGRAPRSGTNDMWSGVTDAEMQRVAGLQRARENRAKALAKLAARRAAPQVRAPVPAPRPKRQAQPSVRNLAKRDEHMKHFHWMDIEDGRNFPDWVRQRLTVWDDPKNRNKLLKRSGRYALAKFFWDEGINPRDLLDWAYDNPSMTDKHVQHLQSTFEELGHKATYQERDRGVVPGEWREPTRRELDEWVDEHLHRGNENYRSDYY